MKEDCSKRWGAAWEPTSSNVCQWRGSQNCHRCDGYLWKFDVRFHKTWNRLLTNDFSYCARGYRSLVCLTRSYIVLKRQKILTRFLLHTITS